MSANSSIEWTDHTFNPWWGCSKVSPACDHCYAERDAKRYQPGRVLWGVGAERRTFGEAHWAEPLKWNRRAAELGVRERVFCASMADVFDKDAPYGERTRLFNLINDTPHLDWLLLTKRIGNVPRMLVDAHMAGARERGERWPGTDSWDSLPPNVWLGITVVNQEEADRDIPKLLATSARVRFLSIEPMLGPIDLTNISARVGTGTDIFSALEYDGDPDEDCEFGTATLDWVIAGGESGPGARPVHPDWFRGLRDQCAAAGVPFLFKQWGEWAIADESPVHPEATRLPGNPCRVTRDGITADHYVAISTDGGRKRYELRRVGKKAAGRLLDGVAHDAVPRGCEA